MKISMICFSLTGWETGQRLKKGLEALNQKVSLEGKSKYLPEEMTGSISDWTAREFSASDALVFIGACGIAVRSIAPFVADKRKDPAVLVIDECGTYVISLLSGHLGGANELTSRAAEILKAVPVITTATDLHRRFAVDLFAKKNQCSLFGMKEAKELSAALLAGEKIGFYSEFPYEGTLPKGLVFCRKDGSPISKTEELTEERLTRGLAVTIHRDCNPFLSTVHVVPRAVALGMGCKKDTAKEAVYRRAEETLADAGIYREAVCVLASHELKKQETGLLALSEAWDIPFKTYTKEELEEARGEFSSSEFVRQVAGVDNVCERSAVCASSQGSLILKKAGRNGVTTAAARKEWRIRFE